MREYLQVEWRNIAPGGNVTHVVVVKPLQAGYFNFTAAHLTYTPSEDAEPQQAFTSMPGQGLCVGHFIWVKPELHSTQLTPQKN